MPASREYFAELARGFAEELEGRKAPLQEKLREIEARKMQIQSQLEIADLSRERLAEFPITSGPDYLCPRCWMLKGRKVPLRAVASTGRKDTFRCGQCGFDVSV